MKLVVLRSNLKEGISAVERAVGGGENLPILRHLLIDAAQNKITLTATNLEIAVQYALAGKVIDGGKVAVPAAVVSGIVNNLSSERLNLEKKGNDLVITSDNYKATVQGLSAEDFPLIPKVKGVVAEVGLKADALLAALRQVTVATEFSDLRPELNSVLFSISPRGLVLAATDSFRLAERVVSEAELPESTPAARVLLPLKTGRELLRILRDGEAVKIRFDENQMLFLTPRFELISRLVEGSFPEYDALVPKKFDTEAVVGREEFFQALKLASVFTGRTSEVKLGVRVEKKAIEVSSAEQGVGDNTSLIPAKIQGNSQDVVFNWRYLHDVFQVLQSEEVFFGISEESAPALFRARGNDAYFYIVKPILKA